MDPRVMELRIKKWIPLIEEQAKSGMTKDEWCAAHGIERTSFFRWQKRVREYLMDKCGSNFSQLTSPAASNEPDFVELLSTQVSSTGMGREQQCEETIQTCGCHPSISIRYGGFVIDINGRVDAQQLSTVLEVLKHAD